MQSIRIVTATLILSLIMFIGNNILQKEAYGYYDSVVEYERAYDFSEGKSGISAFFTAVVKTLAIVKVCVVDKTVYNYSNLENTCIPDKIGIGIVKNGCEGSKSYLTTSTKAMAIAALVVMITLFITFVVITGGLFLVPLLLTMGVMLMFTINACITSYVIAPHEMINMYRGTWKCGRNRAGIIDNIAKGAVSQIDVPFLYTCKRPEKDPATGEDKDPEYGNMYGTSFCSGKNANNAVNHPSLKGSGLKVGSVYVGKTVGIMKRFGDRAKMNNKCQNFYKSNGDSFDSLSKEEIYNAKAKSGLIAFYRYTSGKVQLCAARKGIMAVILSGCTTVPPPYELRERVSNKNPKEATRCDYFLQGSRPDLNSLGEHLYSRISTDGASRQSIQPILFLQGDMHIISTVVGCIEDAIERALVNPAYDGSMSLAKKPILLKIMEGMNAAVRATLVLYLMLFAIKIMSSAQMPQRGEWMMVLFKFVFVVIFALGSSYDSGGKSNIWMNDNTIIGQNGGLGLYSFMTNVRKKIAGIFMRASDVNDPIKACTLQYMGHDNIFSDIRLPVQGNVQGTRMPGNINSSFSGSRVVELSVWDFLDCKIDNYLNMGTCRYDLSILPILWIIPAGLMTGVNGIIIALVQLIYLIIVVSTILYFVHVVIIATFMSAVLVMLSPIFCCFLLFDYTKEIFMSWVRHLVGYMLYPGMLFAFIALMIATFDSIFYGVTQYEMGKFTKGGTVDIINMCQAKKAGDADNSMYCAMVSSATALYKDRGEVEKLTNGGDMMCHFSIGEIFQSITETKQFLFFFKINVLSDVFAKTAFWPSIKIMMFAILFYIFTGTVVSFFEALVGVAPIGKSAFNPTKAAVNGIKKMASMQAQGAKGAAKGGGDAAKSLGKKLGIGGKADRPGGNQGGGDGGGGGDNQGGGGGK